MSATGFAQTPSPPYYAVIFSNQRTAAGERGRNEWYQHFELRVARVERAYGGPVRQEGP